MDTMRSVVRGAPIHPPPEELDMCIICLELERSFDIPDARRMLSGARAEPGSIPEEHLREVETKINNQEKKLNKRP